MIIAWFRVNHLDRYVKNVHMNQLSLDRIKGTFVHYLKNVYVCGNSCLVTRFY